MPAIGYQLKLEIPLGPRIVLNGEIGSDTYSRSTVEVPARVNGTPGAKTINVNAGANDTVALLLISTDDDSYSDDVTFKFDADPAAASYPLSDPFMVLGSAAAELLDDTISTIIVTNDTDSKVIVDIVVGRNAVT